MVNPLRAALLVSLAALLPAAALSGCAGSLRPSLVEPDSSLSRELGPVDTAGVPDEELLPAAGTAEPAAPAAADSAGARTLLPEWGSPSDSALPPEALPDSAAGEAAGAARDTLSPEEIESVLNEAANAFRRGVRSAEILGLLEPVDGLDLPDSLRARLAWVRSKVAERDEEWLSARLALVDSALHGARLDEGRRIADEIGREAPHLLPDPRLQARLTSLERLEAELAEGALTAEESEALLREAESASARGDHRGAVVASRRALRAPDDARRERALALLGSSGAALCASARSAASARLSVYQKTQDRAALDEARALLRECLELYPETAEKSKIERNLRALEKL